ncbi:hypothetical protein FZC33_11360 [Labrys sp. KNU-23]|nr:hypothetical protein FZC33_11360 [Labrys sp. KNU-23]
MAENFDLLGDPIPDNWGKRGRPQHIATQKNRSKVMMLLAMGWSNERIAQALGITAPTLRKNYFRELKVRDDARARLDGTLADRLWTKAMGGSVSAMKEFRKLMERNDLLLGQHQFYHPQPEQKKKAPKLGKKEQAALDAETAGQDTGWGDDLRLN